MKLGLSSVRPKHEYLLSRQELKSPIHEDEARAVGIDLLAEDAIRLASKAEEVLHALVITGKRQVHHGWNSGRLDSEVCLVTLKSFDKEKGRMVLWKRKIVWEQSSEDVCERRKDGWKKRKKFWQGRERSRDLWDLEIA